MDITATLPESTPILVTILPSLLALVLLISFLFCIRYFVKVNRKISDTNDKVTEILKRLS